jgi:4,5-dihydroxyphthalate decarboxylase
MAVRISLSCGYYDRTIPILGGAVQPEGVELVLPPFKPGAGMGDPEADLYELPLPTLALHRLQSDTHIGIPVFPTRRFFQQLIVTRRDSPIQRLEELRGKRVGVMRWYQHGTAVWLRGYLSDVHDISPSEIAWFAEEPSLYDRDEATGAPITYIGKDRSVLDMLLAGQLDAVVHEWTHQWLGTYPQLRRLLPNHKEAEAAYFKETGCFPIIHALFIRREIVDQNPWVPGSLVRAFDTAGTMAAQIMDRSNAFLTSPWSDNLVEEQTSLLGSDLYPVGLARAGHEVERMLRYLHEQGLLPRPMPLEEVFADDRRS